MAEGPFAGALSGVSIAGMAASGPAGAAAAFGLVPLASDPIWDVIDFALDNHLRASAQHMYDMGA